MTINVSERTDNLINLMINKQVKIIGFPETYYALVLGDICIIPFGYLVENYSNTEEKREFEVIENV